jgi:hypothetical protein
VYILIIGELNRKGGSSKRRKEKKERKKREGSSKKKKKTKKKFECLVWVAEKNKGLGYFCMDPKKRLFPNIVML